MKYILKIYRVKANRKPFLNIQFPSYEHELYFHFMYTYFRVPICSHHITTAFERCFFQDYVKRSLYQMAIMRYGALILNLNYYIAG